MSVEEDYVAAKLAGKLPTRDLIERNFPNRGRTAEEILQLYGSRKQILTFAEYSGWRDGSIKLKSIFIKGYITYDEQEDYLNNLQ